MDGPQEPLAMTVHLLADSGHGPLLQQALDQVLHRVCPQLRLFLVSERARPLSYYGKCHPRRTRFPGMSVLLFLRDSPGEERWWHVLDSLRHPPWQSYPTQDSQGRLCPYLPRDQKFYSLDSQMPVWGVRQVHGGAEIVRVTLYCSFDNYEDAVRLYEMILQREAILQKSSCCVFTLYATESFTLQLSLKQLPLGMSVDPKEASVLQFKVQEIGQLVPLLPNPCVPISSTRWQTQDYDGNKILLQVQLNPGLGIRNGELDFLNGTLGADKSHQGPGLTSVSMQRTLETRSRRTRGRRFKVHSLEFPEPRGTSDGFSDPLWKSPSWSSQANSSATGPQRHLPSLPLEARARMKVLEENSFQKLEAETNVDTGFTTISSELKQPFRSRIPRDLQASQPPPCLPDASLEVATSKTKRFLKESPHPVSLAGQRNLGSRKIISKCSRYLPLQGEEKEEEFFI